MTTGMRTVDDELAMSIIQSGSYRRHDAERLTDWDLALVHQHAVNPLRARLSNVAAIAQGFEV
jgi:hypothetical protein